MLESYITPLLMGYVNKYIKNLKPSDLSLSVWGGDVVLQNLELNLDVLQKEVSLPVHFLSGRIHELKINVPWTRLTYKPVTITINTIEFVVKLRDPDEVKSETEGDERENANANELKKEMQKAKLARDAEHLPPGYVQGVINKVINNISICVNNLILKYVEDDIVLTLNVKSVALFSANDNWEQAFVELNLPSLCLRKICNINNLTICLDSRNADGKIEMYQDPILYKCNIFCRVLSKYTGVGSVSAYENQVNIYCESLDLSSTDVQLPMIIRLVKLCIGLYYRTLDLPGCKYKVHPAEEMLEARKHLKPSFESYESDKSELSLDLDDSSWTSWAWSMIPNLGEEGIQDHKDFHYDEDTILLFGVYVTQCSLTLKATSEAHDSSIIGSKRFEFSPVLNVELSGCAVEVICKGEEYFDCQFGVSNIVGYGIGDCVCKKRDSDAYNLRSDVSMSFDEIDKEPEDELIFQLGIPKDTAESGVGFLGDSLFRHQSGNEQENAIVHKKTVLPENGKQFNEQKVAKKFGAFFLDYFYTMVLPKESSNDLWESGQHSDFTGSELVKEISSKRIIIGNSSIFVTSKLNHMVAKIMDFCADDAPQRQMKNDVFIDKFVMNQLRNGNFSKRGLHITLQSMKVIVSYADHVFGKPDSIGDGEIGMQKQNSLYGIMLQFDRIDCQATSPMFPNELKALLESESKQKAMFHRAAYSDYFVKFFGVQLGVCHYQSNSPEPVVLGIMPHTHASVYAKIFVGSSTIEANGTFEFRFKMANITFCISKVQLLMLIDVIRSLARDDPHIFDQFRIDVIFHPKDKEKNSPSALEASVTEIDLKFIQTNLLYVVHAAIDSVRISQQFLDESTLVKKAVLYGPLHTSGLGCAHSLLDGTRHDIEEVPNGPLLSLVVQVPIDLNQKCSEEISAVAKIELRGMAAALDNDLLEWAKFTPSGVPNDGKRAEERKQSRIFPRNFSASILKKKSYARLRADSPSKTSKEQRPIKPCQGGSANTLKGGEDQFSNAITLLKSVILQVEIASFTVFLPVDSMVYGPEITCPEYKIPFAFRTAFTNKEIHPPDTLVLVFPNITVSSSNQKNLDFSRDIPMKRIYDGPLESSLPWSLSGDGFSVYVLTSEAMCPGVDADKFHLLHLAPWTVFLAAADADAGSSGSARSSLPLLKGSMVKLGGNSFTVRLPFEQGASEVYEQPPIGFCIHIDLTSIAIGVSKKQTEVTIRLLSQFAKAMELLSVTARNTAVANPAKNSVSHDEVKSDHSLFGFVDRRSISTASTIDNQDATSISTDRSVFNAETETRCPNDSRVSLWLQWIVPKVCVTFYGEPSLDPKRPWYKVPCEIEDISFSFDYQQGEIRMESKVGSVAVKNFFMRSGSTEWQCDQFGGILLSCDDVLSNSAKALPAMPRRNPRSILTLSYTRQHLSGKSTRKRYDSIRSEAALPSEHVEEASRTQEKSAKFSIVDKDTYVHRIDANVQSFDALLMVDPILNIADSLLPLISPFVNCVRPEVKTSITDETDLQLEGAFQPMPVIEFECKGCRLIAPLHDKITEFENGENAIVFCAQSVIVSSDPTNRVSYTVLHKDMYRQLRKYNREMSRRTKLWHVQYQVDLNGLSLWSGKWNDWSCQKQIGKSEVAFNADGQNPALEWNCKISMENKPPVKLTSLLQDFNCRSTISPALKIALKDSNTNLDLCTTSIEVNFGNDIVAFCNPFQINLLTSLVNQAVTSLYNLEGGASREGEASRGGEASREGGSKSPLVLRSPEIIDSGISSVTSLKGIHDPRTTESHSPQPEVQCQERIADRSSYFPLELFVSGSKCSLSLYVTERTKSSHEVIFGEENQVHRPVGYGEIVQPTLDVRGNSVKSNVYDVTLACARERVTSINLPDKSLYEEVLVRTAKGKQNEKTGLFASAFSFALSMEEGAALIDAKIERPLHVNVSLELSKTFDLFSSKLSKKDAFTPSCAKTASNIDASERSNEAFAVKQISIDTKRVVATLATGQLRLIVALRSMNTMLHSQRFPETFDSFGYNCDCNGFEINLSKDGKKIALISPCIFDFHGAVDSIRLTGDSDERCFRRLVLFVDSSLLRLKISKLHVEYLTSILSCVQGTSIGNSSENNAVTYHNEPKNDVGYTNYSKDDLKTGVFDYVLRRGDEHLRPLPNQISFHEEDNGRQPSMTWRYPVPRFLKEVTVMPLPFHVDEVMPGDEQAEIPCVIRYWDHIEQAYVTYRHFFLSQSKSEMLSFPSPLLDVEGSCQVASEEWQIVVDVAIESNTPDNCDSDSIPEDILKEVTSVYKTPVSATSLAACIKVDSCCISKRIPRLLCAFHIGSFEIALENHFHASENVQSGMFAPFFLDSYTYPTSQETCRLELKSLQCKGSVIGDAKVAQTFTIDFDAYLDVMNYEDLSWRNCLALSSFAAEASLYTGKDTKTEGLDLTRSKLNIEIEAVKAVASQCVVHTLSLTSESWKRGQTMESDIPLLNHYIICNETEDVLRFGQVDTDEDILLASGQMYPYSWRSPHNRAMHLCIDSVGDWKWTAPFYLDSGKGCTRTVKHSTHTSLINVKIKSTGGIQKQVVFKGGVYFRNRLQTDVEFEIFLQQVEFTGHLHQQKIAQVPKSFIVPAGTARPSMSFSPSTVASVYLRLVNDATQGPWSSPILFTTSEDVCLPLTLTLNNEPLSLWYTVSRINTDLLSRIQLCVCPFFVVRNHLSWPVAMTTKPRDDGQSSHLIVPGCGKETEVSSLASSTWYNVHFEMEGTTECTDPPIPINTTFIEILKKKGKLDWQDLEFSAEWPYKDSCSIPEEQPLHIAPQRSPEAAAEVSSPDLQCQLLQRWTDLPTIVIEVRPKFILSNCSKQNLVLRDADTHLVWNFDSDSVLTSPAIQATIQFGKIFEGTTEPQWSSEIYLSELRQTAANFFQTDRDSVSLHPHSAVSFNVFYPARNQCLQFALTSKIRKDIIIITVKERFCVHNFAGIMMNCVPTLCEDESEYIANPDFIKIDHSDEPQSISNLHLIQSSERGRILEPDLSKFSIRFFFYNVDSMPDSLNNAHAFNLSRDHLRENVTLCKQDGEPMCIAMTSYMKEGVINIFLDTESYPSFVFNNETEMHFAANVALVENGDSGKQEKSEDYWEPEIAIRPKQTFSHQCKTFRDNFPKIGNAVCGRLKLNFLGQHDSDSRLFELKVDEKTEEYSIGSDKLFVIFQKASNCFYVTISNIITDISPVRYPLHLPVIHASVGKIGAMVVDDIVCEEVCSMSIDKLLVRHDIRKKETCLGNGTDSTVSLEIRTLQIDNQSTDDYDHFPVVLLPLREVSQRYRGESPQHAPFSDTHASGSNSLLKTVFTVYKSRSCEYFLDDLKVYVEPLEVYFDDSFIYRLISLCDSFSPSSQSSCGLKPDLQLLLVRSIGRQILNPINIGNIEIEDLRILLSIHASVKMYLSADHMPVLLGRFTCHPTRTIQKELTRKVLYHYVTQALVRAGLMLGSLEILANPTGLIRSLGKGVADFFSLPYDGLTRGPSAFVSGIGSGVGSFFRHTSVGALTSVTNFASSLSRNMDRLSLDELHMIRREEQRSRTSSQVWPGFSNALSGFGVSLLGAIAGLVDHPITNIQNADTTRDAVTGAAKGFGKGLVGMVAKPIGGAMELVSQTGQGILLGTGLTKPPRKLKTALGKEEISRLDRDSYMKYLWKVIRVEFEEYTDLFVITDVHISFASDQSEYDGAVILTRSAFYLYDVCSNNIRMAFACNEINLRLDEDAPYMIYLEKRDKQCEDTYCFDQIGVKNDDSEGSRGSSRNDSSASHSINTDSGYPVSLQMHPRYTALLLSEFTHQRDLIEERIDEAMAELPSFKQ